MAASADIRLLGPVEVRHGDRRIPLSGWRQRTVLATLALRAGRAVSATELVDALWADSPPATARQQVHTVISALRRALGDAIVTRTTGYELAVPAERVDTTVFETLVEQARQAVEDDRLGPAVDMFDQALALWRGPALGGAAGMAAEGVRLQERRLTALEERIGALLQLGQHAAAVAELSGLVAAEPLRERLVGQLMLALHRCGRTAEALDVYRQAEKRFAAELGLDPGRELRELELAVLRADPALDPPAPRRQASEAATVPGPRPIAAPAWPSIVPAQLPVDVRGFAGRSAEFAQLDAILAGGCVVMSAVSGSAGVGKTALAVRWAHRTVDRFPDGQLYVNLRGFAASGSVMSPAEAIRGFLDAFGVPPRRIPASLDAQTGLYRSLLAGKRVLVVLDNARDVDQVRPLLPGSPGCLTVVTSRNQLPGLVANEGAHPLNVDLLPADEARQLLVGRLGAARVAAEPDAVDEIITRCARLPLALAIVAARAATHPDFPLAALAGELREQSAGLDALAGGDASIDVRTVFSWSYHILSPDAARLFRLLGVHPGPDVSNAAAASLAGVPPKRVRPLLAELARAHLIAEHVPGRYAFHDLLRAYAAELAHQYETDADRRAVVHRLLDHYLHTAHAAAELLDPYREDPIKPAPPQPGVTVADLGGHEQALAWFGDERPVLLAAIRQAARAGFGTHPWQLAWSLTVFFNRQGHWDDLAATHRAALDAAGRLEDRSGQAHTRRGLAAAYASLSRYDDAHAQLRLALEEFDQLGDDTGRARTHLTLAWVHWRQGSHRAALEHAQQALDLYQDARHHTGQARALNAAGWYHAELGDHRQAVVNCQQALTLHHQIGDRYGQAGTWDTLAYAHHHLGNHGEAVTCYQRALDLYRESRDRCGEADTLVRLGDTCAAVGDPDRSRTAWQQALDIFDQLGHPDAGRLRTKLGQLDRGAPQPSGAHAT